MGWGRGSGYYSQDYQNETATLRQGKSRPMKELIEMVAMVAPSEATVLITGESGTGKELIARAIHFNSEQKDFPLAIVNCAAIAETLLESSSVTRRGRLQAPTEGGKAASCRQTRARSFWTRSARCLP